VARRLVSRLVLITGANRGIGLETARQFAARNFDFVLGVRDEKSGRRAAKRITDAGGRATVLPLDVSRSASIRSAAERFSQIADRLDILVNNAGVYPDENVTILTVPRDHIDRTFQTNAFGALEVTQAFLPYLRKSKAAGVVNVSSGYGQLDGLSPDQPSYCLSKLALNGLTILLADARKGDRIAVNSVCPGWVRTDMGGPNAARSVEEGADTIV
jgi:NAD(P)-dependent dehydrogenase (short-subunit alcohol dehydrogenase family)